MAGSILGMAVRRVEDPQLLLGQGTFIANLDLPGVLDVAFVRSPHAHARIDRVDVTAASTMPGVVAVYAAEDLGMGPYVTFKALNDRCNRAPLAIDRTRFAGDTVAIVIAEGLGAALDAAEGVEVDYTPLESVTDVEMAMDVDAPLQFEELGTNRAAGERDRDGLDPLDGAEVIVRGRFENQRMAVAPIEANAIAALPGEPGSAQALTVYVATQQPHFLRGIICEVFDLEEQAVHLIAPHVGGGFGGKVGLVAEYAAVIASARRLGRPVRWIESRSENLVNMNGRSQVQYAEMGLTREGEILGMAFRVVGDAGAYGGFGGALPVGSTQKMSQGVYNVGSLRYDVVSALTNTAPIGALRGAGRPEASTMVERLVDLAAGEIGIDPVQLRRQNLIRPEQFPFRTHTGLVYDSGDYQLTLSRALEFVGYEALRAEQQQRRQRGGPKLGIGVSSYVEITNGMARDEFAAVEMHPDGTATVRAGTSAHGQGHATAFGMIVADRLHIPLESIRYLQSDTAIIPTGGGTGGSRSLQLGGSAVANAAELLVARASELAGRLLEADPTDIVLDGEGRIGVAGVPSRALSWSELAGALEAEGDRLEATTEFPSGGATFPFGCHVSVVEVDLETGFVCPLRHVAVDDAGRVINPLIFTGQQHGGIAQGIAQALYEEVRYDDEGNPITGTFATYTIPSAPDLCSFEAHYTETLTPRNALGVKGIGEAGTTGATPAVQNAVVDAVSYLGVRHIDMPCTPERVWRAIEAARSGIPPEPWQEPPSLFADLPVRKSGAPIGEEEDL